ncbi:MAG TPA: hypothetical protein VM692_10670 [Gammaproteobacteria bacterium]|nr:hypothetical protein [Gammaproteobacteria bacterium]
MSSKHGLTSLVASVCGAWATLASAQGPEPLPPLPPEDTLFFLQNAPPLPALRGRVDVIRGEGSVMGPVVEGKPYSARSITESTQVLADGNRIMQRNESAFYRDSAGRTRREQTLGGVGPWQTGEPVTIINIHDPVADKTYMLDPVGRIAREIKPFTMAFAHTQQLEGAEEARAALERAEVQLRTVYSEAVPAPAPVPGGGARGVVTVIRGSEGVVGSSTAFAPIAAGVDINAEIGAYEPGEDLGEQVLEGLLVHGTRMKDTIPAGAMGNERPIEIVTERWFSKDIDAMVLERFSDPRVGETVYRLVNVVRGDPSPALFEVPQDYSLAADEGPRGGVRVGAGGAVQWERRIEPGTPAPR